MDAQERLAVMGFVRQLLLAMAILLGLCLVCPPVGILSIAIWVLIMSAAVKRAIKRQRARNDE